jgi:hypothetical protein
METDCPIHDLENHYLTLAQAMRLKAAHASGRERVVLMGIANSWEKLVRETETTPKPNVESNAA